MLFLMYSATKYKKYTFKSSIIEQEIQIECLLELFILVLNSLQDTAAIVTTN